MLAHSPGADVVIPPAKNSVINIDTGFGSLFSHGELPGGIALPFKLFFFLAGLLSFIPFVWVAWFRYPVPSRALSRIGILASSLIMFDIVDNYLFFGDGKNSGFVNPEYVKHDTPCNNDGPIYVSKKGVIITVQTCITAILSF